MLEQHGGMLIKSLEEYLKTEMRLLPGLCSVPFGEDNVVFAKEAFSA